MFSKLLPGKYSIHIEAGGFESKEVESVVSVGSNETTVQLDVESIKEDIIVGQDERQRRTDPNGDAFTSVLTEEQIALLPDDPQEIANTLKRMAGPGAIIRVNGFTRGRLPAKSQISQIRFKRNAFAAEYHNIGFVGIDIITKPSLSNLHGSFGFGFRDEALNARNPFLTRRSPEQLRRVDIALDIPISQDRTSLFLAADGDLFYDSKTIFAALPNGVFTDSVLRPSRTAYTSIRLLHALTKSHILNISFERNINRINNLGVGNFSLKERAYSLEQEENLFRLSETGVLGTKLFNEFRLQLRQDNRDLHPYTDLPAIIVLNAFDTGGAQIEGKNSSFELEAADNLSFSLNNNHATRVGLGLDVGRYRRNLLVNKTGTFIFSSLEDFLALLPTTFTQRIGRNPLTFSLFQFSGYLQDDWRLSSGFTMSLGIRFEKQSQIKDGNNFAPRVGIAWSPFKNGKTTIRAGVGIFYDWISAETIGRIMDLDGQHQMELVVRNPGFPDPFSAGTQFTLPPSRLQKSVSLHNPYFIQSAFSIERQLKGKTTLIASYSYISGFGLLHSRDINAPILGKGRPDPLSGNIVQIESKTPSKVHRFNLVTNGVLVKRLDYFINYSFLKSVDESDGAFSLPADNFNLKAERGPALDDIRHQLFAGVGLQVLRGIRLATNFYTLSSPPYNITTGRDDNGDTVFNDRPKGISRNSARGASQYDLSIRVGWSFGFGMSSKNSQSSGPIRLRVSSADSGSTAIASALGDTEKKLRMNFSIQVSNLLNRVNLVNFTGVQTSPYFRMATSALPGRKIECGLRFSF